MVLPVSFFERQHNAHYNSVAVYDADGACLGLYRKSHIPDGPGYQEKFYFSPGDTGVKVFDTRWVLDASGTRCVCRGDAGCCKVHGCCARVSPATGHWGPHAALTLVLQMQQPLDPHHLCRTLHLTPRLPRLPAAGLAASRRSSAGTNGSQRQRAAQRCRAQSCCCTPAP